MSKEAMIYEAAAFLSETSDARIQYRFEEPSFIHPVWQLCTAKQVRHPMADLWWAAWRGHKQWHRKAWEYNYILQALHVCGMMEPSRTGLGFAVGLEPLAAVMAARGCEIMATDAPPDIAASGNWISTNQHANRLDDLNSGTWCDPDRFRERVSFRTVDMLNIPDDLSGFDFIWSSCALEHLGSLEAGMLFVERAMRCLRPGGVAVHTTEFNLSSNRLTIEALPDSFYRKCDIEALYIRLLEAGHIVFPLNLSTGSEPEDLHVDVAPYEQTIPFGGNEPAHLKLLYRNHGMELVVTSLGLVVQRGPGDAAGILSVDKLDVGDPTARFTQPMGAWKRAQSLLKSRLSRN